MYFKRQQCTIHKIRRRNLILKMTKSYLFTSESVTEGHPDKVCDMISDSILDEYLKGDPNSRVAVETMTTTDFVAVAGEVTSKASFDIESVIRKTITEIGYDNPDLKFDSHSCKIRSTESTYLPRSYCK